MNGKKEQTEPENKPDTAEIIRSAEFHVLRALLVLVPLRQLIITGEYDLEDADISMVLTVVEDELRTAIKNT